MKILKRPENLIFDTKKPDRQEEAVNVDFTTLPPLHQMIIGSDWQFLNDHFKEKNGIPHIALGQFSKSFYYVVSQ